MCEVEHPLSPSLPLILAQEEHTLAPTSTHMLKHTASSALCGLLGAWQQHVARSLSLPQVITAGSDTARHMSGSGQGLEEDVRGVLGG